MITFGRTKALWLVAGTLALVACAGGPPESAAGDMTMTPETPAGDGMHQGAGMRAGRDGMEGGMHQGEGRGMAQGAMGQGAMGQGAMSDHAARADLEDPDPERVARGEEVYSTICVACHTIDPPVNLAPPFSHVARHVQESKTTLDEFTSHVVEFVSAPNADAAVMPEHAIERFGLMPPQPIGEERLRDVAAYMWTLVAAGEGDHDGMNGMRGGGNGGG